MKIGALGGPGTFAGQAAERFANRRDLTYLPSAKEEWQALASGQIEAFVMLAESSVTGFGELARRAASPEFPYYVLAEAQVPYGCLLLAKPGSGSIGAILGHGSVEQCRPYLDRHFPGVHIRTEENSVAAAEKVARGDGSLALVGTAATAAAFGLEVLARDLDGGAVGNYWLVGCEPSFAARPTTLVLSGIFGGKPPSAPNWPQVSAGAAGEVSPAGGKRSLAELPSWLSEAVAAFGQAGYALRSIGASPTGVALFQYHYLLSFAGQGELASVREIAAEFGLRLVGACSDIMAVDHGHSHRS